VLPPENHFVLLDFPALVCHLAILTALPVASNFPPVFPRIWGTKIPRADLIILNSASQTFVNFTARLSRLRRLSKTFLSFFPELRFRNFQ
jgi:hypothetical protein